MNPAQEATQKAQTPPKASVDDQNTLTYTGQETASKGADETAKVTESFQEVSQLCDSFAKLVGEDKGKNKFATMLSDALATPNPGDSDIAKMVSAYAQVRVSDVSSLLTALKDPKTLEKMSDFFNDLKKLADKAKEEADKVAKALSGMATAPANHQEKSVWKINNASYIEASNKVKNLLVKHGFSAKPNESVVKKFLNESKTLSERIDQTNADSQTVEEVARLKLEALDEYKKSIERFNNFTSRKKNEEAAETLINSASRLGNVIAAIEAASQNANLDGAAIDHARPTIKALLGELRDGRTDLITSSSPEPLTDIDKQILKTAALNTCDEGITPADPKKLTLRDLALVLKHVGNIKDFASKHPDRFNEVTVGYYKEWINSPIGYYYANLTDPFMDAHGTAINAKTPPNGAKGVTIGLKVQNSPDQTFTPTLMQTVPVAATGGWTYQKIDHNLVTEIAAMNVLSNTTFFNLSDVKGKVASDTSQLQYYGKQVIDKIDKYAQLWGDEYKSEGSTERKEKKFKSDVQTFAPKIVETVIDAMREAKSPNIPTEPKRPFRAAESDSAAQQRTSSIDSATRLSPGINPAGVIDAPDFSSLRVVSLDTLYNILEARRRRKDEDAV